MADVDGITKIKDAIERLKKKYADDDKPYTVVGYTANYALYVHENLEARHEPGKQPKFLEQPARENKDALVEIVKKAMKGGATLQEALNVAGLRLQRESQLIVPVSGWDPVISPQGPGMGNLKQSAFTRDKNGDQVV